MNPARISPPEPNPYLLLTSLFFTVMFFGLLWEWFSVSVLANEQNIRSYQFGSKVMMSEGGSNYATSNSYATDALQQALVTYLPLAAAFCLVTFRDIRPWYAVVFITLAVVVSANYFTNP